MGGHDPTRFDYLFEPIDGDAESAWNGDVGLLVGAPVRSRPKRSWPWLVVVAATIVGVGVALIVLWSTPVDAVHTPSEVATTAPPKPIATTAPVIVTESFPMPAPAPEPTAGGVRDPEPALEPSQASVVPAVATPVASPASRPPSPTVRSPMSVSPAPRPAFPNQHVPDGDGPRRGLLGRGGLL